MSKILIDALRQIAAAGATEEPSQPEYDSTLDAENFGDALARFELAEIARKALADFDKEAKLSDAERARRGELIAAEFGLRRDPDHSDRYSGANGNKTAIGVFETAKRYINEGK